MELKYTRRYQYLENQKKGTQVTRTIKLIMFMREWHSVAECADHIGVNKRTINRYFHLIIGLGCEIRIAYRKPIKYRIDNIDGLFATN